MQPGWPKAPVELNTLFVGSTLRKIQAQNGGSERRPKSMQEASLPSQPRYHPKSHGSFPVSWSLAVSSMKPIYGALTGCQHWQDCFVQVSEHLMSSYHVEDLSEMKDLCLQGPYTHPLQATHLVFTALSMSTAETSGLPDKAPYQKPEVCVWALPFTLCTI